MTSVSVAEGLFGPPGRQCTILSPLQWEITEAARLFHGDSVRGCSLTAPCGLFSICVHVGKDELIRGFAQWSLKQKGAHE